MMNVDIKVTPDLDELKKRLADARADIADQSTVMKKASIYLDRWVQTNFKTEGGKVGGWRPLKAGGRWKNRAFDPAAKILQDTGRLRLSFVPFATEKNSGIGSDLDYSRHHEKTRRMLPKKDDVAHDIEKLFRDDLSVKIKKFERKT